MQARNEEKRPGPSQAPYFRVLKKARGTSRRILDRLRALSGLFPDALPPEALEGIERATAEDEEDRRRSLRLSDKPAWVLVCLSPPPAAELRAPLRDHSAFGLGLYLDRPVAVGAALWVRLADDPEAPAEWALAEVRHCRRAAQGWFLGCELVTRLSEEE